MTHQNSDITNLSAISPITATEGLVLAVVESIAASSVAGDGGAEDFMKAEAALIDIALAALRERRDELTAILS